MEVDNKRKVVSLIAEAIDNFRVFPRLALAFYAYLLFIVINWYMGLPVPITAQTILVTTVVGILPAVVGLYQKSGRSWLAPFINWDKDKKD